MTDVSLSKVIANVLDNSQLEGGGRRYARGGQAATAPEPSASDSLIDQTMNWMESIGGGMSYDVVPSAPSGGRSGCMLRGGEGPTAAAQASAQAALTLVAAGEAPVEGGEAEVEGGKRKLHPKMIAFNKLVRSKLAGIKKKHPNWGKAEQWKEAMRSAGRSWRKKYGSKTSRRR
jgi:hypothetical protein